ncbi:MAG: hypothetical protein H7Z75_17770 [Ferruginibacter sp.]|nr:hypothetical protein [Cytophagales bacterium]
MNDFNPPQRASASEDEIDLGKLFLNLVEVVERNARLLLTALAIGVVVGYLYHLRAKTVYESSLVASSRLLTSIRVERLVSVLNKLAGERNDTLLAKAMNVGVPVAAQLASIEASSIKEVKEGKESTVRVGEKAATMDDNVFEVAVRTYDNRVVDTLQKGILHYLRHNDFVEKRVAIQKQNLEILQGRVQEEEKKLDSLRFLLSRLISRTGADNSTTLMTDPGSVNKDLMALYEKELYIREELLLIDDIQVIQNFTPFSRPAGPTLWKTIAVSTGVFLGAGLLILLVVETRRGVKRMRSRLQPGKTPAYASV